MAANYGRDATNYGAVFVVHFFATLAAVIVGGAILLMGIRWYVQDALASAATAIHKTTEKK